MKKTLTITFDLKVLSRQQVDDLLAALYAQVEDFAGVSAKEGDDLSLIELIAMRNALEGYTDAFGDDDLFREQVEVVEGAIKKLESRIKQYPEMQEKN